MRRDERGQILVLFAILVVGLIAIAALAIDVSSAYAARQGYRTAADAAALAGAQDLQVTDSRAVTPTQYANAKADAQASIEEQFGAAATCTPTSASRNDCTFTSLPYQFAIITPLPAGACVSCDTDRSVQVNFGNPTFQLSFAHLVGIGSYRVAASSVAGLQFDHSYAVVTLRPPSSAVISGIRDINVASNVHVVVTTGDVGTNANMVYGGVGARLFLDPGYKMYFFDPSNGPFWSPPTPPDPPGTRLTALIPDPQYVGPSGPSRVGAIAGSVDVGGCPAIALTVAANPNYAPYVPMAAGVPDMTKITCYTKGIYPAGVSVPNGTLGIFEPGLYFFDDQFDAQGSVIGGYTPNSEGVAFVFPETQRTMFKNRTNGSVPGIVALNAGTRYLNPGGREATAASDNNGGFIETNTTPAKLITLIVPPDTNCPVVYPFPSLTCTNNEENKNIAIDLTGGSGLYLAGIQYAPTDNVSVAGNTATGGYVGQIWSWTLFYAGNSQINQEGDQTQGPGVLRLDAACTAPGTPCIP